MTKYCRGAPQHKHKNVTGTTVAPPKPPPSSLVKLFKVLLGPMFQTPDEEARYGPTAPYANCETLMAMYVVTYCTLLLNAMDHQRLDGIYAIETSSVCNVAQLAGLYHWNDTVYRPQYDTVYRVCGLGGGGGEQQQREGEEEEYSSINRDDGDHAEARSTIPKNKKPPTPPPPQQQQQQQRPGVFGKTHNTINKGRLTAHELIPSMKEKSTPAVFEMVDVKMRRLYARLQFYEYPTVEGINIQP